MLTETNEQPTDLSASACLMGEPIRLAHEFLQNFIEHGNDGRGLRDEIFNIVASVGLLGRRNCARRCRASIAGFNPRGNPRGGNQWGEGLEPRRVNEEANAVRAGRGAVR